MAPQGSSRYCTPFVIDKYGLESANFVINTELSIRLLVNITPLLLSLLYFVQWWKWKHLNKGKSSFTRTSLLIASISVLNPRHKFQFIQQIFRGLQLFCIPIGCINNDPYIVPWSIIEHSILNHPPYFATEILDLSHIINFTICFIDLTPNFLWKTRICKCHLFQNPWNFLIGTSK